MGCELNASAKFHEHDGLTCLVVAFLWDDRRLRIRPCCPHWWILALRSFKRASVDIMAFLWRKSIIVAATSVQSQSLLIYMLISINLDLTQPSFRLCVDHG